MSVLSRYWDLTRAASDIGYFSAQDTPLAKARSRQGRVTTRVNREEMLPCVEQKSRQIKASCHGNSSWSDRDHQETTKLEASKRRYGDCRMFEVTRPTISDKACFSAVWSLYCVDCAPNAAGLKATKSCQGVSHRTSQSAMSTMVSTRQIADDLPKPSRIPAAPSQRFDLRGWPFHCR